MPVLKRHRRRPGIAPMPVRQGDRVRIRVGNLTMDNHPVHLHGHTFEVAGTDGGWIRSQQRWPEVAIDIAPGQMRAIEFDATEPGDWAFHCHKTHHTMNAMDHAAPDHTSMDEHAASMGTRHMPLPPNTLPMTGGAGPFGSIEMGGMFTVVKVRSDQKPGDYTDPGWYRHPAGTVAYEWTVDTPAPASASGAQLDNSGSGDAPMAMLMHGHHHP